jgi:ABC-type proline/glycine betaine transport system permease subunit
MERPVQVDASRMFGQMDTKSIVLAGTTLLYFGGYLSLRFKLTALGVSTELGIFDERYLFAGASFLVYALSAVPSIALIVLFVYPVIVGVTHLVMRAKRGNEITLSDRFAKQLRQWGGASSAKSTQWIALITSILVIQVLLKQMFFVSNVAIDGLPREHWLLYPLLLQGNEWLRALFYCLIVLHTAFVAVCTWAAYAHKGSARAFAVVLTMFLVLQASMLPVVHGVFSAVQSVPRLDATQQKALASKNAWLLWEGKESYILLVGKLESLDGRELVTILKKDLAVLRIVGYDQVILERPAKLSGTIVGASICDNLLEADRRY